MPNSHFLGHEADGGRNDQQDLSGTSTEEQSSHESDRPRGTVAYQTLEYVLSHGDERLCAYAKIPQEGKVALGDPQTNVKDVKSLAHFEAENIYFRRPGNVRELESIIERALILCPGPVLQLADKLEISSPPLSSAVRTLEETERNQILKTLSETRWRIEGKDGAAAILGLNPSTLRARMHKLGIVRPETKESD